MSEEQIGTLLQGRNYHSQYELMRYARLANKKGLADQIISTLGRDGIRTALREATTNKFAPHFQREELLEWHRRDQTEIGRFLDGRIIDYNYPHKLDHMLRSALNTASTRLRLEIGKIRR